MKYGHNKAARRSVKRSKSLRSHAAKRRSARKSKRGGSRNLKKLVPWSLVLANQLFTPGHAGKKTNRRRSRKSRTRRRRRRRN